MRRFIVGNPKKKSSSIPIAMMLTGAAALVLAYTVISHQLVLSSWDIQDNDGSSLFHPLSSERVFHQKIAPGVITTFAGKFLEMNQFLPKRPRKFGYYFETSDSSSFLGSERMDPNVIRMHRSRARPDYATREAREKQKLLLDSREYKHGRAEPLEEGDCLAQYDWQTTSFPTCNFLMEQALTDIGLKNAAGHSSVRFISNGYWRDVWRLQDNLNTTVMKTMRYEHDYTPRNYDRHRRDAVAMERLTGSQYVMDIYGYCGNSGLFEFGDGGSLDDSVLDNNNEDQWSPSEKLIVAYQAAAGLSDFHNWDKEGVPAMAHTDITPTQFVYVGESGLYKLNDFNRARFLRFNQKTNKTCTYQIGNNPGMVSV